MPTTSEPSAEAKAQIASVIAALSDSWNQHDMAAYGAQFADDADFVNVVGMHWNGREEITPGTRRCTAASFATAGCGPWTTRYAFSVLALCWRIFIGR